MTQKHVYNHAGMEGFFPGTNSLPARSGRDVFPICKGEALPSQAPLQQGGRIPGLVQLTHGHPGCRWRRSTQLQDGISTGGYHTSFCLMFNCADISSVVWSTTALLASLLPTKPQTHPNSLSYTAETLHCLAARQLSLKPGQVFPLCYLLTFFGSSLALLRTPHPCSPQAACLTRTCLSQQ